MKELFNFIDKQRDLVIELQQGLTSHPAVNPDNGGNGEMEKFLWFKNYLSSWGFDSLEEVYAPDERVTAKVRPTLIATIEGNDRSKKLWLITHTDVVPPGEITLWETDPFSAVVKGDRIYGRGTEDNQQSLVSTLVAAKALLTQKIKPKNTVKLMFVADEEVGSDYGIKWVLENTDLFSKNDYVITPDVGDPEGLKIEIAEKSILWVLFKIKGKQSHGSRPDQGINAARASSYLCVRLDEFLHKKYNAKDPLFDIDLSTFEPTKRIGTVTNMNTIPGEEILGFDCRILPQYNLKEVLADIDRIISSVEKEFGVKIEYTTPQNLQAPPVTPQESPVVQKLFQSIKTVTGKEPHFIGIGGGTVAAYFREKGIAAALWSTVDNTMHSPNEYSSIKNTLLDAAVFAHLMIGK